MCSLFYGGGGESLHAGLAGDRTAFASKMRFGKKKRNQTYALISPPAMVNDLNFF